MSAIAMQHEFEPVNWYQTRDPVLACTLGTIGFRARGREAVQIIYNGNAIVNFVDSNRGTVNNLASVACNFELFMHHGDFGKISCVQVGLAHELAKVSQQRETGDLSPEVDRKIYAAQLKCNKQGVKMDLFKLVQYLYDDKTNWTVLCETIRQLNENPLLKFSKGIAQNGVAHTLNPVIVEATAFKRSERLYRGEKGNGRVHYPAGGPK